MDAEAPHLAAEVLQLSSTAPALLGWPERLWGPTSVLPETLAAALGAPCYPCSIPPMYRCPVPLYDFAATVGAVLKFCVFLASPSLAILQAVQQGHNTTCSCHCMDSMLTRRTQQRSTKSLDLNCRPAHQLQAGSGPGRLCRARPDAPSAAEPHRQPGTAFSMLGRGAKGATGIG